MACAPGDPGDLFPDVPYSDKVAASPVTHQEASLQQTNLLVPPPALPDIPPPAAAPTNPPEDSQSVPQVVKQVSKNPKSPIWAPYSKGLFTSFLSAEDRATFDQDYAPLIRTALKGNVVDRRNASDSLFESAEKANDSPKLQRYLYLHALGLAIHGAAPGKDCETKARAVLPLLKERTLAVAQARADCLDDLMQYAMGNASENLQTMTVHAYATLAELQVQAGYPREATENLKTARHWLASAVNHNSLLTTQLITTGDWVSRANSAAAMIPGLKTRLAADPKDNLANMQLAQINLGIYGDLGAAVPYAGDAPSPALQKLPELVKGLKLPELSCASKGDAQKSLPIIQAMVDIARSVTVPDRYLIARHAQYRLELIAGMLSKDTVAQLLAALKSISNNIADQSDPYQSLSNIDDLAANSNKNTPTAPTDPPTNTPTNNGGGGHGGGHHHH